jgi:hypothetical protein
MDIKITNGKRRVKLTKTETGYCEKVRDLCAVIASNSQTELGIAADTANDAVGDVLRLLEKQDAAPAAPAMNAKKPETAATK